MEGGLGREGRSCLCAVFEIKFCVVGLFDEFEWCAIESKNYRDGDCDRSLLNLVAVE